MSSFTNLTKEAFAERLGVPGGRGSGPASTSSSYHGAFDQAATSDEGKTERGYKHNHRIAEHLDYDAHQDKPESLDPFPDHVFAEGGTRAWLTVLGTWIIYFVTFGLITAFGVFESFYVTRHLQGKTPSEVAWIGSLQLCLILLVGVISGKLLDEGYFHHVMIAGSVLEVVGIFTLSASKTYTQIFLSQGLCCGLGMGLMFLPAVGVIQHHFHARRAFASGIAATGTSVGGIVFSIMFNQVFKPSSGVSFAAGCQIAGGIVAVLLIVANLVMKTALPPRKLRKVQIPPPNPVEFFRDWDFNFVLLGASLAWFSLYIPVFYIQLDAELHGVNHNLAFYLLTVYNVTSLPGRIIPNYFADKYGIFNACIACLAASGFVTLGMLGISSPASGTTTEGAAVAVAIFYGFFSGAVVSLLLPLGPAISRGPHEYGLRIGIIFLFTGPCGLLSGPIAGWLLGSRLEWGRMIAFATTITLASGVSIAIARHFAALKRQTWKV